MSGEAQRGPAAHYYPQVQIQVHLLRTTQQSLQMLLLVQDNISAHGSVLQRNRQYITQAVCLTRTKVV